MNKPGIFAHKPGSTAIDLIMRAGGVTRYASVEQIRIITKGQPSIFNLQTFLDSGKTSLLPELTEGATIFVPKQLEEIRSGKNTVYVMGEVAKPAPSIPSPVRASSISLPIPVVRHALPIPADPAHQG